MGRILWKLRAWMVVLTAATVLSTCAREPRDGISPAELTTFVDSIIPAEMASQHIPGAAFVFVQNGRVVLERSYGMADIEHNRVVDTHTIWRIGSISKVFTATAVMQLVEQGRVNISPNPRNARTSLCASCWITPPAWGQPRPDGFVNRKTR